MNIRSSAFQMGASIPSKYTCDGKNISPPLEFIDVPSEAKSLVLLMDDPDVPRNIKPDGMFDHWVVFNIPSDTRVFGEGKTPPGMQSTNSAGQNVYTGPCPPDREHRYFFKLYALDTMLNLAVNASKKEVESAMEGHILMRAELMGRYNRIK